MLTEQQNMQQESTINPGIWQGLKENNESVGYGLVQWTPSTNYTNWADEKGYEWDDGNGQCEWIDSETTKFGQWIRTSTYDLSFTEFKSSTETPEYLAYAFMYNFERPASLDSPVRQTNARYWFEYLNELNPTPPPLPLPKKKGLKVWQMCRKRPTQL